MFVPKYLEKYGTYIKNTDVSVIKVSRSFSVEFFFDFYLQAHSKKQSIAMDKTESSASIKESILMLDSKNHGMLPLKIRSQ